MNTLRRKCYNSRHRRYEPMNTNIITRPQNGGNYVEWWNKFETWLVKSVFSINYVLNSIGQPDTVFSQTIACWNLVAAFYYRCSITPKFSTMRPHCSWAYKKGLACRFDSHLRFTFNALTWKPSAMYLPQPKSGGHVQSNDHVHTPMILAIARRWVPL